MPQRQILVVVGGGFEACRSMPQRAKIFTWRTFFFITCQTSEPFVAQVSRNWMVAQWSMYQVPTWRVLGSISRKDNFSPVSSSLLLHRPSLFGVVLTCQVLRILKLKMMVPLTNSLKHAAACRSMPQRAKFSWGPLVPARNPCFVAWPLELGLGTRNLRFVAWPLELGLGTRNPRLAFAPSFGPWRRQG